MTVFKAKLHQIRLRLGFYPDPAGGAYLPAVFGGPLCDRGRVIGEEEEKMKGREGEVELLLNQGHSEPCYATADLKALHSSRVTSSYLMI